MKLYCHDSTPSTAITDTLAFTRSRCSQFSARISKQRWNRVTGHRVSDFGRVGSGHGSVCQTRCLTRFWVLTCAFIVALFYRETPSRQTNIRGFGFGSVPVTALLIYLFQLLPVIFTYVLIVLVTSRTGRVGSRVKNPDPVVHLCLETFHFFSKKVSV